MYLVANVSNPSPRQVEKGVRGGTRAETRGAVLPHRQDRRLQCQHVLQDLPPDPDGSLIAQEAVIVEGNPKLGHP
eukprot:9482315-Pyramimonas_sp.AAC.1